MDVSYCHDANFVKCRWIGRQRFDRIKSLGVNLKVYQRRKGDLFDIVGRSLLTNLDLRKRRFPKRKWKIYEGCPRARALSSSGETRVAEAVFTITSISPLNFTPSLPFHPPFDHDPHKFPLSDAQRRTRPRLTHCPQISFSSLHI